MVMEILGIGIIAGEEIGELWRGLVPQRALPPRPSSLMPSLSRATLTTPNFLLHSYPISLSMAPEPGRFRLPPCSPSPMLSTLSWGDSPLSPLPQQHSLPSLDAFIMEDLSPHSPPPVSGPSGLVDWIWGPLLVSQLTR